LGGANVETLMFSPDGANLIFVCTETGSAKYLRQVRLKLSDAQHAAAAKGPIVTSPRALPATAPAHAVAFRLTELQSLNARAGGPMTPKDISHRFDAAVVLVASGDVSGSGFVVGSSGYVLTCAHVVADESAMKVVYTPPGKNSTSATADAKVIAQDQDLDIALLKIDTRAPLPYVVLAGSDPVDAAESVTVIGNPGVGETILSHTITTGVVSNPSREIDGVNMIQMSAAVNPGSSGGPMFDSKGQVVGLVCMKANIEAAGFALPSAKIREFLKSANQRR
jgi:S1-C subfamily serine protease